ncbi:MAG: phosphonate C-P lyase system protein PhnH [Burkholderiaceae bacterium]|nr:phosphonate C-P lyase system protein PhnH [Burkholderiaceae bacterium]
MSTVQAPAPGFAEPVTATQACFRGVLWALSHPGRAAELPTTEDARPPRLAAATAALLLTLLDAETTVRLHGSLRDASVLAWLRFHTGTREAATDEGAPFVAVRADQLNAALWSTLPLGSDEAPQDGCTLIVELPLSVDAPLQRLSLRGPGVPGERLLEVAGVPAAFWTHRVALQREFPRGFDMLLARGRDVIAIPRSARVEMLT